MKILLMIFYLTINISDILKGVDSVLEMTILNFVFLPTSKKCEPDKVA